MPGSSQKSIVLEAGQLLLLKAILDPGVLLSKPDLLGHEILELILTDLCVNKKIPLIEFEINLNYLRATSAG